MGLIDKIFGSRANVNPQAFGYKGITELDPIFTSYQGALYEQELTRSAIQRFADACAKLKPECHGTAETAVQKMLVTVPNETMTWPVFLAKLATIYEVDATAFIVPTFKRDMTTINGLYPLRCEYAEIVEYKGEPWVRFNFTTGDVAAIELKYVAIVPKFQYTSDFFGEPNCIDNTMSLIHAQNEAQHNAIRNGAKIRFIGKLTGQVREEDMEKKRERFVSSNFNANNTGGMLVYDQTFDNVQQVEPQSYTMSSAEMEQIKNNVFSYFGINEDILQNKYNEETWAAWYEGRVETFAVKVGEALTRIVYSPTQMVHGNGITFSSNRLEYATTSAKMSVIKEGLDRGVLSLNEAREILQLPPVEGGEVRVIRGEYTNADNIGDEQIEAEPIEAQEDEEGAEDASS